MSARRVALVLATLAVVATSPDVARAEPAPTSPPSTYAVPEAWPAMLPPGVASMPPGFMDAPGRWPRKLAVDDARLPPPLGYRLSLEPRRGLWVAGVSTLASSYGLAALIGGGVLASDADTNELGGLLFVPLLGPVLFAAANEPITTPGGKVAFAFGALASATEGTGFGLLLAGFVFPRSVYLRNDVDGPPSPTVSVVPAPNGLALHATW